MLPTLPLVQDLDANHTIIGPGIATLDWSVYTDIFLRCGELNLELSLGGGEITVVDSGANIMVKFRNETHHGAVSPGQYRYRLMANDGTNDFDVAGEGMLDIAVPQTIT